MSQGRVSRIRKQKTIKPLSEIGSTGLERTSGTIHEEFLKDLQGKRGIEIYREMRDNDAIVGAMLFAIEMLIRRVEWRLEAASTDTADVEAADFIETCLHDMSMTWEETISEILSMLVFGWSYHEVVYKRRLGKSADPAKNSRHDDGRIGWRKLPIRAQETLYEWKFSENGALLGMVQQAPPNYQTVFIPIEKALLFRTKIHKGSPEGRSILRTAYRAWYFKKHIENIEGIGIERDLAGLPMAEVPANLLDPSAGAEEKATLDAIKKVITNVRRDEQEGLVFPLARDEEGNELYRFKLLSTGGTRQFDTDKVVKRKNAEIASTVLADFILLGHDSAGSHAMTKEKTSMFASAISAWLDVIASEFNRFAIPRLLEINTFNVKETPQLVHGDIENINLEEIGNFLQRLAASGAAIFPNPELEKFLVGQAGLPEDTMDVDEEAEDDAVMNPPKPKAPQKTPTDSEVEDNADEDGGDRE